MLILENLFGVAHDGIIYDNGTDFNGFCGNVQSSNFKYITGKLPKYDEYLND